MRKGIWHSLPQIIDHNGNVRLLFRLLLDQYLIDKDFTKPTDQEILRPCFFRQITPRSQKKLYCTTCCYWLQHAAFQLACAFWRKNWLLFAVFACATFSPTPFFNLSLFSTLLLLMWNWTISLLNVVALIYFLLEKVTRIFSNKWNNLHQKLK